LQRNNNQIALSIENVQFGAYLCPIYQKQEENPASPPKKGGKQPKMAEIEKADRDTCRPFLPLENFSGTCSSTYSV
jgi:hypothetical protein